MAISFRTIIAVPAAALSLAVLASCGEEGSSGGNGSGDPAAQASLLFPDGFKGVCSGASVSAATAYDPAAATHKALYFTTHRDDFTDRSHSLPPDWTVLFSPDRDALRAVDLVVCARRTAAQQVKICDGYRSKGRETQNRVRWHTATYELSVREARTGRELAKTTAEAASETCPMFQNFDGEADTVDGYASLPDAAVTDFLRPHITR